MEDYRSQQGNLTYDFVASFVRNSLKVYGKLPNDMIDGLLPVKKKNFDDTNLLQNTKYIAKKMDMVCDESRIKVIQERMKEIVDFTDLRAHHRDVRESFNEMMRGWLKNDGHNMSWERVIMVINFTAAMVKQNVLRHGTRCGERIQDLVGICTDFIDNNMYTWIQVNGSWEGISRNCKKVFYQTSFDIPSTSLTKVPKHKVIEKVSEEPKLPPPPPPPAGPPPIPKPKFMLPQPKNFDGTLQQPSKPREYIDVTNLRHTPDKVWMPRFKVDIEEIDPDDLSLTLIPQMKDSKDTTHDVIMGYIVVHFLDREETEPENDPTLAQCVKLFQWKEVDMSPSDIVGALADCGEVLMTRLRSRFQRVLNDWNSIMDIMIDVDTPKHIAWEYFDQMCFAWFIQDNKPVTFERIIVMMTLVTELIHRTYWCHGVGGFKRISELLEMTVIFFRTYFQKDITKLGGWKAIIDEVECIKVKRRYDIQYAVYYDPSQYKIDDKNPKPIEQPERLAEKRRYEEDLVLNQYLSGNDWGTWGVGEEDEFVLDDIPLDDCEEEVEEEEEQEEEEQEEEEEEEDEDLDPNPCSVI